MSTAERDRPVGLWVVGVLSAGVVVLALWLANTGPTLRYEAYGHPGSELVVTCTGDIETNDTSALEETAGPRKFYRVDSGEKALSHVSAEYEDGLGSEDYDALALDRSINADCAHAVVSRQWMVIWVLATLVPLAVAFVLMGVARMLPPPAIPALFSHLSDTRSRSD